MEVDPDDGTITLHWSHRGRGQDFALVFQTRYKIIGVLSDLFNRTGYPPWRLPLDDQEGIGEKLSHPTVKALITKTEQERELCNDR